MFSDQFKGSRFSQAIGNPLGNVALRPEFFGKLLRMEGLREPFGEQFAEVRGSAKSTDFAHLDQPLVLDDVFALIAASPSASPPSPRIAPFLHFDEHHIEGEASMRKDLGEVDHFVEQIEQTSSLGTATSRDFDPSSSVELDQCFLGDNWLDNAYGTQEQEIAHLIANCGKRTMLDFDEFFAANGVDPPAFKVHFVKLGLWCIQRFQLAMQRAFHGISLLSNGVDTEIAHRKQRVQLISPLCKRLASPFQSIDDRQDPANVESNGFTTFDCQQR